MALRDRRNVALLTSYYADWVKRLWFAGCSHTERRAEMLLSIPSYKQKPGEVKMINERVRVRRGKYDLHISILTFLGFGKGGKELAG